MDNVMDSTLINWVFDKDNLPDNKDNSQDAKMFSIHYDPKTGSFVPTQSMD